MSDPTQSPTHPNDPSHTPSPAQPRQSTAPTNPIDHPLAAAPTPTPAITILPPIDPPHPNNTDLGNAQRMVQLVKDRVHYVPQLNQWFVWSGSHWRQDTDYTLLSLAKATILAMHQEAIHALTAHQPTPHPDHLNWIIRSAALPRLETMISLLRAEPGISIPLHTLDQSHHHLPCRNGTINLRTGNLEPANPAHLFTRCLDLDYDPTAQCPLWHSFLHHIMGDDLEMVAYLQRLIGHTLTGDAGGKYFLFLWGPQGNNGKSTLVEILLRLLGPFALKSPVAMIMPKYLHAHNTNDIARLHAIRLTVTQEVDQQMSLSHTTIKDLTGRDTLTARFLRHEYFEFTPTHKLWLYGNHRPQIRGGDPAIWDRVKLLPFLVTIPPAQRDPHLLDKLTRQLPGILAWAVAGCLQWQRTGINTPYLVKNATDDYRFEQDIISNFIHDCCTTNPAYRIPSGILYGIYLAWCRHEEHTPETQKMFGLTLDRHGYPKTRTGSERQRSGLTLNDRGLELARAIAKQLGLTNTDPLPPHPSPMTPHDSSSSQMTPNDA